MAAGSAIRGSRVGAGPMGEEERGEAAPRVTISYWCANGHETRPSFVDDPATTVPAIWDCPRCGFPAGTDPMEPPDPPRTEPYKTHLAYVKERRTDEDGAILLAEALAALRERRGDSERAAAAAKAAAEAAAEAAQAAVAAEAAAEHAEAAAAEAEAVAEAEAMVEA